MRRPSARRSTVCCGAAPKVIYDAIVPIHVSGHASQEEQKLLINLIKPKHFLPIHGELRQLRRHGQLAVEVGIPEEC